MVTCYGVTRENKFFSRSLGPDSYRVLSLHGIFPLVGVTISSIDSFPLHGVCFSISSGSMGSSLVTTSSALAQWDSHWTVSPRTTAPRQLLHAILWSRTLEARLCRPQRGSFSQVLMQGAPNSLLFSLGLGVSLGAPWSF